MEHIGGAVAGKASYFDGQCQAPDMGAAAQIRQAINKENQLKQTQAGPPVALPPTLNTLAMMVCDSATDLYRQSDGLVDQINGPNPPQEVPPREYDGIKGTLVMALRYLEAARVNLAHSRQVIAVLLLCLILGGVAIAQKPAAPAPAEDNIACATKVQPTTGFTECEMLRLSNYIAQISAIQKEADAKMQPVSAAGNEFIGKVVAIERNKGKQYESPSQQFPLGRLVPIPPPPPTPPTPAATTPPPAAPATPPAKQ